MGRTRGFLWLLAGLIVAMLAGVVGFMTLSGATAQRSGGGGGAADVPVVVAAQAVPIRSLIKPSDVVVRNIPVSAVPEGALRDTGEVIGKLNLAELYPGEVLLRQRVVDPNVKSSDGRIALAVADDQVLIAYPANDLLSRSGVLKPGDRVDLLFSVRGGSEPGLGGCGRPAGCGERDGRRR